MSPRPFERPATILLPETDGLPAGASLEGLWLPARGDERGGAVVAPPHPLMGGRMESPVATELALAASDGGRVAIRFNWRGIGASAGEPSGETDDADADYRAALEFVADSVEGPIVACGYSWGALAAARTAPAATRVQRLLLVAPPPAMLDGAALAAFRGRTLIVAGNRDEYVPLDALQARIEPCERAELVVLDGADHFFGQGLGDLGRAAREWLGPATEGLMR